MLEGIEILSQTPIRDNPQWLKTLCMIVVITLLVSLVLSFILIKLGLNDFVISLPFFTGVVSFIGLIPCIILLIFVQVPTGKYEYKVIVDDSVSMNEFQEKYEIIRTEGKIYIIKEKE